MWTQIIKDNHKDLSLCYWRLNETTGWKNNFWLWGAEGKWVYLVSQSMDYSGIQIKSQTCYKHPSANSMSRWSHWSHSPMLWSKTCASFHPCFLLRWWTEPRTNSKERESIPPFTTWKLPVKRERRREEKQTNNLPTVIPLVEGEINHWLSFIQCAPWKSQSQKVHPGSGLWW